MAATEDAWTLYAHHRARLTDAILSATHRAGGANRRLCLLGAGECNDVDLEHLAETFAEIHVVDIDPAALAKATSRQTPSVRARLHPHARVDLSGVAGRLKKWKRRPPDPAQLEREASLARQALVSRLPGPFDVVASTCVLTQMAFAVRDELGDKHPIVPALRYSVAATHVDTLIGLTAPGGVSLFVTDLSSSSLFALDALDPDADLRTVMNEIVGAGVYYHAASPMLIGELLNRECLRGRIGQPAVLAPWLWTGTLGRTYLVYALELARRI